MEFPRLFQRLPAFATYSGLTLPRDHELPFLSILFSGGYWTCLWSEDDTIRPRYLFSGMTVVWCEDDDTEPIVQGRTHTLERQRRIS